MLPCPYCGEHHLLNIIRGGSIARVHCQQCGVSGPWAETNTAAESRWDDLVVGFGARLGAPDRGAENCPDWNDIPRRPRQTAGRRLTLP